MTNVIMQPIEIPQVTFCAFKVNACFHVILRISSVTPARDVASLNHWQQNQQDSRFSNMARVCFQVNKGQCQALSEFGSGL